MERKATVRGNLGLSCFNKFAQPYMCSELVRKPHISWRSIRRVETIFGRYSNTRRMYTWKSSDLSPTLYEVHSKARKNVFEEVRRTQAYGVLHNCMSPYSCRAIEPWKGLGAKKDFHLCQLNESFIIRSPFVGYGMLLVSVTRLFFPVKWLAVVWITSLQPCHTRLFQSKIISFPAPAWLVKHIC